MPEAHWLDPIIAEQKRINGPAMTALIDSAARVFDRLSAKEINDLEMEAFRRRLIGDPCPECDAKGFTVSMCPTDYGDEASVHDCRACDGWGYIVPLVQTEEFVEEQP